MANGVSRFLEKRFIISFWRWKKESDGRTAHMVEGVRRAGRPAIVEEFAKTNIKAIGVRGT